MNRAFNQITKIAIEELVKKHLSESKYGYFVGEDDLQNLVEELTSFLATSRSLKNIGDKMIKRAQHEPPPRKDSFR